MVSDRDRLAADLHAEVCIASSIDWDLCVIDHRDEADRLIKRGWTLKDSKDLTVDEERLARALATYEPPHGTGHVWVRICADVAPAHAAAIAKAYREDTDATR